MKKLLLTLTATLMLFGCSDDKSSNNDSSNGNLSNTPTAKATYNNNNYGIYKGVFIGSTGNIVINLNNDGNVSATLVIDGKTYNFTTKNTVTQNSNTSITFSYNENKFDFAVNSDGSSPIISNISISGHTGAAIQLVKEKSDAQVYCYEGIFTEQGGNGTLNIAISQGKIKGIFRPFDDQAIPPVTGTVANNIISATIGDVATITGTITDNTINGEWHSNTGHGTWKATRKL